ncbi:DsbA family protein [Halopseudomonas pelagia]|uniref:DsbA family protein n=1 Tax=Halopseudomonas pelagia TaxID=553151 RepID=UPI0030D8CAA4|tara:strand:- start:575 stop:1306 length:732 start_codon:yes stop_codon:yes gene_type:complete
MGEAKRRHATGGSRSGRQGQQHKQALLWSGALLAVLALGGLAVYLATPGSGPAIALPEVPAGTPPFPAELDSYGVQLGDPDAPVVVREFADYQCPACASFARVHERFKTEYIDTGKARLVFFELPLAQHRNAMPAAQAARCAGDQGEYWGMHDLLFAHQSRWSTERDPLASFNGYADQLKLNQGRFERCLTREQRREEVEASLSISRQLRVASTPTVLVDNIPLSSPGWEQLSGVIERQLDAQ